MPASNRTFPVVDPAILERVGMKGGGDRGEGRGVSRKVIFARKDGFSLYFLIKRFKISDQKWERSLWAISLNLLLMNVKEGSPFNSPA